MDIPPYILVALYLTLSSNYTELMVIKAPNMTKESCEALGTALAVGRADKDGDIAVAVACIQTRPPRGMKLGTQS